MEIEEKRLSRRLKVNLPVNFEQTSAPRQFGETTTKDISISGLRMNMDGFFAPSTNFLIKLHFPEVNRIIEAMASVVWSHRISYSDQYQAGLHFCEINPMHKKWLEEYIIVNEALGK
ncbi:MAG TPA: PilZ domain-containing protein [Candidatus Omnitrophota bacterium]|nr:PilZ domain-containing protein [Candidatus Omnitrophota bacterium]